MYPEGVSDCGECGIPINAYGGGVCERCERIRNAPIRSRLWRNDRFWWLMGPVVNVLDRVNYPGDLPGVPWHTVPPRYRMLTRFRRWAFLD